MRFHVNKHEAGCFLCALAGIFSMNPYFVWPSFLHGILNYLTYLLYASASFFLFLCCSPQCGIRKKNVWGTSLLIIIFLCTYFNSGGNLGLRTLIGACLSYFFLFCLFSRDEDALEKVYKYFIILFIFSVLPGLLYYILELFGISLSIGTIQSENQLAYSNSAEFVGSSIGNYKLYIGAVMRINSNTRMSGIFDEPGLVGTVAALLLCARRLKFKQDPQSIILFIILFFSFSFAGYIIFALYIVFILLRNRKWKLCLFILIAFIGLIIFMRIDLSNTPLFSIQNRFQFTKDGLTIINNRQTSTFEKGYALFKNASIVTKLFGFGYGASSRNPYLLGSSSYKLTIYNSGYFTFLCMILFFCSKMLNNLFYQRKINISIEWDKICLLLLFLISIYQRPAVFYPYYFIILFGGNAYIDGLRKENLLA